MDESQREVKGQDGESRMSDKEWLDRRGKLFPDGSFDQELHEGIDQFVSRLRKLEDGKDPFENERRSLAEETVTSMSTAPGRPSFRDERDRELWSQRNVLWLMPSKRKYLRSPLLAEEKHQT